MTIPSDSAGNQEHLHTPCFSHPFDEGLDAHMRHLTNTYYGWRFKYQLLQELLVRQEQSLGENLSDFEHILHTPFPTLAQYLAYLSHLGAVGDEAQQTGREPGH